MAPKLLRMMTSFPEFLFRIAYSSYFRIRHLPAKPRPGTMYDLVTEKGMVMPRALHPATYQCM